MVRPSHGTSLEKARENQLGQLDALVAAAPMIASRPEPPEAPDIAARYEEYRPKIRAFLARDAPWLDSDAREEVYQQGWLAVLEAKKAGRHVESELSYLFGATQNIAVKAIASADARRRITFDPIESRLTRIPDDGPTPLERATVRDEAAVGRSLLDRLGPSQRAVAIRRYGHGYSPEEICEELGITRRRYEKTIDKISIRLGAIVADYHAGRLTSSDRKLLARCVLGEAEPHERQLAARLVDSAHGRALLSQVRHVFRDAAMAAPIPLAPSDRFVDQLGAAVEHSKAAIAGVIGRTSASATETVTNLSMSGAGRGSGAFAAGIVACVICSAGAVSAVTGTSPADIKDAIVQTEDTPPQPEPTAVVPTATETVAAPPPSTTTTPVPSPEPTQTSTAPASEPEPAAPEPRPEFGFEQQSPASPTPSTSAPSNPSSRDFATPAAPSGGAGGGGSSKPEFGFEGG